jgi:hypothetical protein
MTEARAVRGRRRMAANASASALATGFSGDHLGSGGLASALHFQSGRMPAPAGVIAAWRIDRGKCAA